MSHSKHYYPKTISLCIEKHIKLYLGPCKIVKTQRGNFCLVSPQFGYGYYGTFAADGSFYPTNECRPEFITLLDKVEAEGLKAVAEIGVLTGVCCICGRTLTAEESIAGGIGPICGDKVGWMPSLNEEL